MNRATIEPPAALLGLLEARAPLEGLSLLATWPWLALMPRGDGRPVMLAPAYGASEASLYPLFGFLAWLGYDVRHWGLGRNRGKVAPWIDINLHKADISPERGSPAPQPRDHR